jgi:hypothetical protein
MNHKPKSVTKAGTAEVTVFACRDGGDIAWSYAVKFDPPGIGVNKKETLKFKEKNGDYDINFKLVDHTDLNLSWSQEPIWIVAGTTCPTKLGSPNLPIKAAGINNGILTVTNDSEPGDYAYSLNFDSKKGPQSFDPIIKNGTIPFVDL